MHYNVFNKTKRLSVHIRKESNRLVGHKKGDKVRKEETSFILNGGATVQGEDHKDYHTEWSLSPAIELPALQYNLLYLHLKGK